MMGSEESREKDIQGGMDRVRYVKEINAKF